MKLAPIALLIILFFGVTTVSANLPTLKYQVTIRPKLTDSIHVHLHLCLTLENSPYVVLYAGKIQIPDISARTTVPLPVRRQENFMVIGPLSPTQVDLDIQYTVTLGRLAKHGHQGYLSENLALFGGEQLFLIPAIGKAAGIEVQFRISPEWKSILPPSGTNRTVEISDSTWLGIYHLMKNNYAFGSFDHQTTSPDFYFLKDSFPMNQRQKIATGARQVIQFYETRFYQVLDNFHFVFVPESSAGEYLMGGIGPSTLGFTLNPDALRDWQLLAHRLFHVFFDRKIHRQEFYAPPYLWLQEALAVYYEILAPAVLTAEFPDYRPEKTFAELYRRYLYFYFKNPELFRITPENEQNLAFEGQTEFLHYTQAPLTVLALAHEISRQNSAAPADLIWQWLAQTEPTAPAEMPVSLGNLSGSQLESFFANHVSGAALLDLREPLRTEAEKKTATTRVEIFKSLQEYEYLLWTWFRHVPEQFSAKSIETENFEQLLEQAEARQISFAAPEQEKLVRDFSPTVYGLLKIHFLRLAVCGIDPAAPTRNQYLQHPENQKKWQDFQTGLKD